MWSAYLLYGALFLDRDSGRNVLANGKYPLRGLARRINHLSSWGRAVLSVGFLGRRGDQGIETAYLGNRELISGSRNRVRLLSRLQGRRGTMEPVKYLAREYC